MKNKVFIFWIGDKEKIEKQVNNLKNQGLDVVIGPSKSDDEFLMREVPYYKISKMDGIYSFCSDVWRFYILSKEAGLYIDANEHVGPDFADYFDIFKDYDIALTRASSHTLGSSFLYSNGEKKEVFSEAFNLYKYFNSEYPRLFPIGPDVITWVLKSYYEPGFDFSLKNGVAVTSLLIVRDKRRYYKVGHASWSKGFNSEKYSQKLENNFKFVHKIDRKSASKYYFYNHFPKVDIAGLRDQFDSANSNEEKRYLINEYKKFPNKIFWNEKIIWSKLFRLFTLKWLPKRK